MPANIISEVLEMKRAFDVKKAEAIKALLDERQAIMDRRQAEIAEVDEQLKELGYAKIEEPEEAKPAQKQGRPLSYRTRLIQRAKWKIRQGKDPDTDPSITGDPELQAMVKELIAAGDSGFSHKTQAYRTGQAAAAETHAAGEVLRKTAQTVFDSTQTPAPEAEVPAARKEPSSGRATAKKKTAKKASKR